MIQETQKQLPLLFSYLWALLRNPVKEIQNLPEIRWPTLIAFQFCLSSISVILANVLSPYGISFFNIIVSLVIAIVATGLVSLFFYYFFLILYNRELSFIRIFTLVLFAHLPFAIFHLGAAFFPPADLIGLAISALLMMVGLVDNFHIPKRLAARLMVILYAVFFIYWVGHLITMREHSKTSVPQGLDQMEKEIKNIQ